MSVIYKTFKTARKFYLYDREKDKIITINEDDYNSLNNNGSLEKEKVIKKYQRAGYLKDTVLEEIEHPATVFLEHYINNRMQQVILQVTQNCNLRCGYCVYSGNYYNRVHSNKIMDYDVAKKAMDMLIKNSKELNEITLSFYGGEPLLNLNLIKKCVNYMKENVEDKVVKFSMTTNGTLLTPEVAHYLEENKFDIMISLDGSKNEHDRYRKFANGKGSFDTIIKNVRTIKECEPNLFKRITFNAVMNPKNSYSKVRTYFEKDDLLRDADIALNIVEENSSKVDIIFEEEFYASRKYEYFKLLLSLVNKLDRKYVSRLEAIQEIDICQAYDEMKLAVTLCKKAHHSGPCIPGSRRLFVNCYGDFFPCERVSENSSIMNIGNITDGINYDNAKKILNVGKITEKQCLNCWALQKCVTCVSHADENGKLSEKKKLSFCESSKENVLMSMKEMVILKDLGYKFREER